MTESRRGARRLAGVLTAVVLCPGEELRSCGLCPTVRGGLTVVHPKSIDVAIAIRRDFDAGVLEPRVSTEDAKHSPFRDLQMAQVLAVRHGLRDGFELVVIEDGAHYRIDRTTRLRGRRRDAPPPPIVRWVTGRAVLEALLKKELSVEAAVDGGLLVVEEISATTATHGGVPNAPAERAGPNKAREAGVTTPKP